MGICVLFSPTLHQGGQGCFPEFSPFHLLTTTMRNARVADGGPKPASLQMLVAMQVRNIWRTMHSPSVSYKFQMSDPELPSPCPKRYSLQWLPFSIVLHCSIPASSSLKGHAYTAVVWEIRGTIFPTHSTHMQGHLIRSLLDPNTACNVSSFNSY